MHWTRTCCCTRTRSIQPTLPESVASSDDFTGTLTVLPGPYAGTISATATGFSGAQPSSRLGTASLTAGTDYFLVQTSFRSTDYVVAGAEGGPTGPFYTGIGGPGNITLVGTGCTGGGGGDPVVGVDPSSLSAMQPADTTTDQTLTISNTGGSDLDWSITEAMASAPLHQSAAKSGTPGAIQGVPSAWTDASPVPANVVRYAFAQDGEDLYVMGGVADGSVVGTLYRYNTASDTWTTLAPMPVATGEAPTGAYFDGKLYVVGGNGVTALNIYDIATDTWSSGAPFPDAGGSYGAAGGAYNGKFFVAGGTGGVGNPTLWVYDIASDTWAAGTPVPNQYFLGGYQQVGQYVYMVGSFGGTALPPSGPASALSGHPQSNAPAPSANGTATIRLDMSSAPGTWSTGPVWTMNRADLGLAYDPGTHSLYAIGGDATGGTFFDSQAEVDQLDISAWPSGTWVVSDPALPAPLQANQAGFYTTGVAGGEIWSTGGIDSGFVFHNTHQYRTNGGGGVGCSNPSDLPWVSVNPASGTTTAGNSSDVTVTFDSTGLADGDYSGLLCVNSNDPATPVVEVPVSLTVTAGVTHTVTPSVGTPSGTIAPSTPQTVNDGATTDFTLTPDSGFHIDTVGGTCGGTLAGDVFTTDPVTADCTVVANFAADGGGGVPGTFPPDENFDEQTAPNIPSDWTTTASGAGMPWVTDDTTSDTAPNSAHAMDFPAVSDMTLDTPTFTAAAGQTLTFEHQYNVESGFDGAVLEISINGGAFADIVDAGGSFESGGYNGTISSSFSSPIAGRAAWTGSSGGFIQTVVDLPAAAAGQPTVLRFRTADDSSFAPAAPNGWWVDTIHLGGGGGITHTVTPSVGTPSGTITPDTPQTVDDGTTTDFTLTPDSGFHIDTVGGTCGGNLSGNVFTTAPVTADCTVVANFAADGGGVPGTFPPDENFDEQTAPNIPSDWTTAFSGAGMPWVTDDTTSDTAPNSAHAMDFPAVSDMTLDTPAFTPVAGQTVTFHHQYNLESTFDGAVLEISIDGGPFQDIVDAGGSFESGGYDGTISTSFMSPIAGRMAWTGASTGFITTVADLPASATGLSTVLRFRTADDSSVAPAAPNGWWVDTIHLDVSTSAPPMATFTPTSFTFTVPEDGTASDTLNIANAAGSDPLTYSIVARGTMQPVLRPHATASNSRALHEAASHGKGHPQPSGLHFTSSGVLGHSPVAPPWTPRGPDGSVTFQADDGTFETSVSLNNGTTQFPALFINRYQATGALTIDSIAIEWPDATTAGGDLTGESINLVAYYDADGDGDPTNAVRLGTDTLITIGSLDAFETYPTNFSVPGAGDVYIGFEDAFASGGTSPILFDGALDEDGDPTVGYISGSSANMDPDLNNLANNDLTGTISDLTGGSLPGVWMVRATGTGGGGGPCTGPVVTWLTANPASGTVNGGSSQDVTVTVDPAAGGLTAGDYTAELCATTNDPTQMLVSIPVSVTVTAVGPMPCDGGADEIFCNGFDGTGGGGGAGTYDDRATFITHVGSGFFENPFDDAVPGLSDDLNYSQGGFAYTVGTETPCDMGTGDGCLYNDTGLISTSSATDQIVVTFTGNPVTAVGGNFWATDINVVPTGTSIVITLSDGTTETFSPPDQTGFRGFTTAVPITSITIDAPDDDPVNGPFYWSTMDNLIVGSAN